MEITQENRDCFTLTTDGAYVQVFVYGIFLSAYRQLDYDMSEVRGYTTVKDFVTVGHSIVQARYIPDHQYALTGKLVELPVDKLPELDRLESGYERVVINTTSGDTAFMYAERGTHEQLRQTRGTEVGNRERQELELQSDSTQART